MSDQRPIGPERHRWQQHGHQQYRPQQHGPQQYGPQQYGPQQYGPQQYGPQPYGPGPREAAPGPAYPGYPGYPGWVPPGAATQRALPAPLPPGISRASYGWVWGVTGVLALSVVVAVGLGVVYLTGGPQSYGDDPRLDALWNSCERGAMRACDRLFEESPLFSEYERFGLSCGERSRVEMTCAASGV